MGSQIEYKLLRVEINRLEQRINEIGNRIKNIGFQEKEERNGKRGNKKFADRYIDVYEAAEIFHVSQKTVYNWSAQKLVPKYKINGRLLFKREDINKYLRSKKRGHTYGAGR